MHARDDNPAPLPNAGPASADTRSDAEIIAAINAGGPRAAAEFEALYQRHKAWVYSLAMRFTSRHEEALDVTQEVFIYLLGKFPGFELTSKLTTFLYPAVKHIALARRRRKTPRAMADEVLDTVIVPAAPAGRGDLGELAGALSGLSEVHREIVLMRFVDGMSMEEMSAALGVPVGTVKSRLHNAVSALRDDARVRRYFGAE